MASQRCISEKTSQKGELWCPSKQYPRDRKPLESRSGTLVEWTACCSYHLMCVIPLTMTPFSTSKLLIKVQLPRETFLWDKAVLSYDL